MIEYLFYAGLMIMLCIAGVGIIGKRSQDMLQHDVLVEALNDSK
jgi:hypothetical protein